VTSRPNPDVGSTHVVPALPSSPRDRFDLARDLVDHLSDAGLCAVSTWECAPPTVSVSARLAGTDPSSSRGVWGLPWPGRDVLYWQWPRTAYRGGVVAGRWFEPLCPIADTARAAAHLVAAVRLIAAPPAPRPRSFRTK